LLLRKLLIDNVSIDKVFDMGLVVDIIRILEVEESGEIIKEASWILSILTSTNKEKHIEELMKSLKIQVLLNLLLTSDHKIKEHVVFLL